MLRRIVTNSVKLVKFVLALGLSLSRPQKQHVLNLVDAILVSDERKTAANGQRLRFRSKYGLAREMLAEIAPLLPADFQVHILFDSWYSSAKLIKYCRRQNWHIITGLKSNRDLNGKQLSQWHKDLRPTRYERAPVPAADGSRTTYFVRPLQGRLNQVPFEVCVLISKRHPRSKSPAYFLCTDLSLSAQEALVWDRDRWPTEVDNFYLKTRLGLADYQLQAFEAIEKFHALGFLALAYLQYRLIQSLALAHQTGLGRSHQQLRTLADVIRLHRAEHDTQLLKAACQLAMKHNSFAPVLTKFLRPLFGYHFTP